MKNALTHTIGLNESANHSLGRVLFHTINANIAALTAHKSHLSIEENNIRNGILKQKIKDAGYGYIRVRSNYAEHALNPEAIKVNEDSLLVIGRRGNDNSKLLNDAKAWGEEFGQDYILHKAHDSEEVFLHGTSKNRLWPKYGEAESIGKFHPNKAADYYPVLLLVNFYSLTESVNSQNIAFIFSDQSEYWRAKERAEQLYCGNIPNKEKVDKERAP